jgi:hypothetical protein
MNRDEFMRRADELIDRLTPRLDPQQSSFIRNDAYVGEWDEAIDNLIATLVKHNVPITVTEKQDLLALTSFMRWPDSRLDGVNVAFPPPGATPDHAPL